MFRIATDIGASADCEAVIYPARLDRETRRVRFNGRTAQLRCISPGEACSVPTSDGTKKTICAVIPDRAGESEVCAAAVIAAFEEARRAGAGSAALIAADVLPSDALIDFVIPEIRAFLEINEFEAVVISDAATREKLRERTPEALAVLLKQSEMPGAFPEYRAAGAAPAPKPVRQRKLRKKRSRKANGRATVPSFESEEAISFSRTLEKAETRLPPSEFCEDYAGAAADDLERLIGQIDESFSEMLLRLIDEAGITDAECYKRANVDRKLFSKIRSNRLYRPSKQTAVAFAIALRLDLKTTSDLLMKAGFALSHSSKFDIIVEYFISRGVWDLFTINETLFAYDQPMIGCA